MQQAHQGFDQNHSLPPLPPVLPSPAHLLQGSSRSVASSAGDRITGNAAGKGKGELPPALNMAPSTAKNGTTGAAAGSSGEGTGGGGGGAATASTGATGKRKAAGGGATGGSRKRKGGAGNDDGNEKKRRSRAACVHCKSTKQRCDGPTRIPCRRCELYGLECKYPPAMNIVYTPHPPPKAPGQTGKDAESGSNADVTQKLYEIAHRLSSIESFLHSPQNADRAAVTAPSSSGSASHQAGSASSDDEEMIEDDNTTEGEQGRINSRSNPIQEVNETLDKVVGVKPAMRVTDIESVYDVVQRGVMTLRECQSWFDFFFLSLHPWVMMLSLDDDRDAIKVHQRSSLLFHTILVLSTSYTTPFPSLLHSTLVSYTNSILAPQILSPQPHELTTDFLRAIDLLNLYKPTQLASRKAEGMDESESMRASKVNGLASWMLQGILGKTSERLELANILTRFTRSYNTNRDGLRIPKDIIRDLRLYYWLLSNDVHGNVQSGRRCNMEGAAALSTTRLFSSLQLQPFDTRLAASVEMFEVARPILRSFSYERTRRISKGDLDRYNQGMATWEDFWLPVLQSQLSVDPLAMTVLCPFQWFITLTFNASAYVSWKQTRNYYTDSGGDQGSGGSAEPKPARKPRQDGPRGLSPWEFEGLERCVKAAEGLIFTLCEESRIKGGWRAAAWSEAERADGGYRNLALDASIVEQSSFGMDAITCVAYIFPLVFLTKLVNEGILTADLALLQTPSVQYRWKYTQKLPRLLELGASFLDAVSMNPHHPAKSQASLLRNLLEAGIRGRPPTPQLPRHASTVMSPLPASNASIFPSPPPSVILGPSTNSNNSWQQQSGLGGSNNLISPYSSSHLQQHQQNQMMPPGQSPTGMDQALTAVLDGFDPLFGESSSFWEWGGLGAPGQSPVDWASVQAFSGGQR